MTRRVPGNVERYCLLYRSGTASYDKEGKTLARPFGAFVWRARASSAPALGFQAAAIPCSTSASQAPGQDADQKAC